MSAQLVHAQSTELLSKLFCKIPFPSFWQNIGYHRRRGRLPRRRPVGHCALVVLLLRRMRMRNRIVERRDGLKSKFEICRCVESIQSVIIWLSQYARLLRLREQMMRLLLLLLMLRFSPAAHSPVNLAAWREHSRDLRTVENKGSINTPSLMSLPQTLSTHCFSNGRGCKKQKMKRKSEVA